jgi:metal-dependent amidase/aminoacylase/carboxypeptidase family protein
VKTLGSVRAPREEAKARLARAVEAHRDEILELSHRIHANPEPAFEEHLASALVAETLARHGFEVTRPAGRLATAVRATRRGGLPAHRPRVPILAEYDALPGLGHGCGHNTMAASGVGAAIALATLTDELPGEIVFLGTPAEVAWEEFRAAT